MFAIKSFVNRVRCDKLLYCNNALPGVQQPKPKNRNFVTKRFVTQTEPPKAETTDDGHYWPRKIFSGIQPTGELHLGNYLGAIRKWTKLQETREDTTFCIVDMHSITVPQNPGALREQIFKMAATLLACGIEPNQSTLFVQSAVKEHSELCWLLGSFSTMTRLGHLPQYKDKTRQMKEIPLGLFIYPVMQAADILLYKATHVPAGEDQVPHIQLTQLLSKIFNARYGRTFPVCHAVIENRQVSRIRALSDPTKKMSKSDPDPKSAIYLSDEDDIIVDKIRKAVTDFSSDISYEPDSRLGVSNLITIHSQMSGLSIEQILDEARTMDTSIYKHRVAEAVVEHLRPIREKILIYMEDRNELISVLEKGAEKARIVAADTIEEVKQKMGLGASYLPIFMDLTKNFNCGSNLNVNVGGVGCIAGIEIENNASEIPRHSFSAIALNVGTPAPTPIAMALGRLMPTAAKQNQQIQHMLEAKPSTIESSRKLSAVQKPIVPQQKIRVEKNAPRRTGSISGKPAAQVIDSFTDGLLSLSLLQRQSAPPQPPQSPLQAFLPKYQEQSYQSSPRPNQTPNNESTRISPEPVPERKVRRISGCIKTEMSKTPNVETTTTTNKDANQNKKSEEKKSTLAVIIAKTKKHEIVAAPTASTTQFQQQLVPQMVNVPAAVSPLAEVKAAVAAAKAEMNSKTQIVAFLPTIATTSQLILTRNFTSLSKRPTRSFSASSENDKENSGRPRSIQSVVKLLAFAALIVGAGFSGAYYFCRSILKTYFDMKKNDGS